MSLSQTLSITNRQRYQINTLKNTLKGFSYIYITKKGNMDLLMEMGMQQRQPMEKHDCLQFMQKMN